jgi:hypothetical protein
MWLQLTCLIEHFSTYVAKKQNEKGYSFIKTLNFNLDILKCIELELVVSSYFLLLIIINFSTMLRLDLH